MELNESEINRLEKIAKGIDKTLDITDLYLTYNDFLDLNKIIVKLREERVRGATRLEAE